MFSRFTSVRAKLLGCSALLLLFTVVIGVVGTRNLASVEERAERSYAVATAPLAELAVAGEMIAMSRALTYRHLLVTDPGKLRELEAKIADHAEEADAALDRVAPAVITPEGKRVFAEMRRDLTEGLERRARVIALSRAGDKQEAFAANTATVAPLMDRAVSEFDELLKSKRSVAEAASKDIASTYESARTLTIVLLIAAFVLGALASLLLARSISRDVGQVLRAAHGISEGDVDQQIDVRSRDEIGAMASAFSCMVEYLKGIAASAQRIAAGDLTVDVEPKSERDVLGTAFKEMTENLRDTVGQVQRTAESVSSASQQMASTSEETGRAVGEIASAVGEVATGAQRQVESVESARAVSEEVLQATERSQRNATETAESATQAREVARAGAQAAQNATEAMEAVRSSTDEVTAAIRNLGDKSQQIGGIVDAITGIAEQTNLLALNAAIEAARAGEQGRGFAVVADEVRKLAEESQSAAGQIADLIGQIQAETDRTVQAAEAGAERTAAGATTVEEARAQFVRIGDSVDEVTGRIDEITAAVKEIARAAERMHADMNDVASVAEQSSASTEQVSASTQQTSASAQEIAASAQQLSATATELNELVRRFQLS
jgi:methyl-accepting chemotaxis protein